MDRGFENVAILETNEQGCEQNPAEEDEHLDVGEL
jgi:hypothetical protein